MLDEILSGVFGGLHNLFVAGIGYFLFFTGKYLVNDWETDSSASKGMPKWKAAIAAPIVGLVLGALAATPSTVRQDDDGLFGGGEVTEVIEVERPYKVFVSVFLFSSAAMWLGVAKSDVR
jgi:hypothetical protein